MELTYNDQWTSICSKALALLGRETLTSYEHDDTADASLCRLFLPEAVGIVAEYFDWTFLSRYMTISPDSNASGPYKYNFTLPLDIARLSGVDASGADFSILSGRIFSDSASCTIRYIAKPRTTDNLSDAFIQAVIHYLAYLLAKPLSGNDSLKAEELQLYQYWVEKAATDDRAYLSASGQAWWTEEIG